MPVVNVGAPHHIYLEPLHGQVKAWSCPDPKKYKDGMV